MTLYQPVLSRNEHRLLNYIEKFHTICSSYPFDVGPFHEGFAVPKDSEYFPLFSKFMLEMKQNGYIEKLQSKYAKFPELDCPSGLGGALKLEQSASLFAMLICSFILSVIFAIAEVCIHKISS